MKREVWLKTNRRAHYLLSIVPASISLGGVGLVVLSRNWFWGWSWMSGAIVLAAVVWLLIEFRRAFQPRLAYQDGMLLVYLRGIRPTELPIQIVECFFLGQGASFVPRPLEGKHGEAGEAATVVVRLAESAKEWSHRDVDPSLGQWCEGYITIRGTWSEPLSSEFVGGLNQKLVAAHRALKQARETVPA